MMLLINTCLMLNLVAIFETDKICVKDNSRTFMI